MSFCFALSRFSAAKRACAGDREFVADMLTLFGRDVETRKSKVQQEVESDRRHARLSGSSFSGWRILKHARSRGPP